MGLALFCLALASGCNSCGDFDVCDPTASTASVSGIWTISGEGTRAGCADPRFNGAFGLGPSANLAVDVVSMPYDAGPMEPSPEAGPLDSGQRDGARDVSSRIFDAAREAAPPDAAKDGPRDALPGKDGRASDGLARDGKARDGAADRIADRRRTDSRRDSRPRPAYHYMLRLRSAPAGFSLTGQVQGSCVYITTRETDLLGTVVYELKGKVSGHAIKGRFTGTGPEGCFASGSFTVEIH